MSTVVYRDGVLAADSRAYGGHGQDSPGEKRKIYRLKDGSVVGVTSGVLGMGERFAAWLNAGGDPSAWTGSDPDLRAIIIRPGGEVFLADDGLYFSGPIRCDHYAIGSGAPYAMGAMAMGASAVQAVHVAIAHDCHSGGRVRAIHVR